MFDTRTKTTTRSMAEQICRENRRYIRHRGISADTIEPDADDITKFLEGYIGASPSERKEIRQSINKAKDYQNNLLKQAIDHLDRWYDASIVGLRFDPIRFSQKVRMLISVTLILVFMAMGAFWQSAPPAIYITGISLGMLGWILAFFNFPSPYKRRKEKKP